MVKDYIKIKRIKAIKFYHNHEEIKKFCPFARFYTCPAGEICAVDNVGGTYRALKGDYIALIDNIYKVIPESEFEENYSEVTK